MKIRIICVGKLKEKYLNAGVEEYLKRLQGYCKVEVYEVADESIPDNCSLANEIIGNNFYCIFSLIYIFVPKLLEKILQKQ